MSSVGPAHHAAAGTAAGYEPNLAPAASIELLLRDARSVDLPEWVRAGLPPLPSFEEFFVKAVPLLLSDVLLVTG